jgi:hypothetical protein
MTESDAFQQEGLLFPSQATFERDELVRQGAGATSRGSFGTNRARL